MEYVNIKDKDHLVRDVHSKAILNTDKKALDDYYIQKKLAKKQQEEKEETKMRLIQLEKDMAEIKSILMEVAQLRNKECQQ
jgi:hypothetical protein